MKPMWRSHDLKKHYDVIIVGGGGQGLATAYNLARMGVRKVAVLEARYIGYGGSGRNTAILRSNYRTPEGIAFYDESLRLFETLSQELDFNLMLSRQGHFTLGHSDGYMQVLTTRAEYNKAMGVDSEMVAPGQIKRMIPELDISTRTRHPIQGALYHPPGGIIRHDAVVWAYARAADRLGVEIHNLTPVEDIVVTGNRVEAVVTPRGTASCDHLVSAVAGWSSELCRMVGLRLPIMTHPLQALVTESYKPWLHHVVVSGDLHIYLSQTDRGELVCGNGIDQCNQYSMGSTLAFLESYSMHLLELFPILHNVRVQRQWAGLVDVTPDYAPIISTVDGLRGFYLNAGWGTYGFKGVPGGGLNTAKLIVEERVPEVIEPFRLSRFAEQDLVAEKAAASVAQ